MKTKEESVHRSVRMPVEVMSRLETMATKLEKRPSTLMRALIILGLRQLEDGQTLTITTTTSETLRAGKG